MVGALQYWVDLGQTHKVMPGGTIEWGTLRQNFLEQKTAMMWHSTGNLTAVKKNAAFDFGVAMLPASVRRGTPTGGGNFYIFKKTTPEERKAAMKLIRFLTEPERTAEWSIKTGYLGTRPDAYHTKAAGGLRPDLPAGRGRPRPAGVRHGRALDLPDRPCAQAAGRRDPSGADRRQVAGRGPGLGPRPGRQAGSSATAKAAARSRRGPGRRPPVFSRGNSMSIRQDRLVHVYGWLLLMPAAVLLIAFTHYPTLATLAHSLFTDGTAVRPARFVGLENYELMLDDEVFWKVVVNNLWYAAGTIPVSIALALLMAVWVNGKLPARGLVRMAYFTPTVLPMIAVANIWLFFYSPDIGLLDQVFGRLWRIRPQLAGRPGDRARLHHRHDGVEGGRVFHDLLPRRPANPAAGARRGGQAGGRQPAGPSFAGSPSRS